MANVKMSFLRLTGIMMVTFSVQLDTVLLKYCVIQQKVIMYKICLMQMTLSGTMWALRILDSGQTGSGGNITASGEPKHSDEWYRRSGE